MGLIGLLKFALICVDFLAWPVIALGYPLFASIRAVETGSKHHMRKLVIYWTLFSLISLFEFALVKIIEWIPFWSSVRLIAVFWLVMPQFNGACHAYQSLVRPVLSNLQAVIDRFYKPNEEKPHKRETFLDVAEKYIKENGTEALEKLIASKHECKECKNSQRDTQVLEPEEKNAAATSKQLKEPGAAQHDNEMLEATKKSVSTEAKPHECKECKNSQRDTQVLEPEEKNAAATSKPLKEPDAAQHNNEMLEATEKSASTEAKQHECIDRKNSQRDTQVLKPEKKNAAATLKQLKEPGAAQHDNEMLEATKKSVSTEAKPHECKDRKNSQRDTQVLKPENKNAAATLKQLKGPGAAQHDNEMLEATEKSVSTEAKPVQHAQSSTAAWVPKGTVAATKVKETTPPKASAGNTHPETTPPLKVQHAQSTTAAWVPKGTDAAAKVKEMTAPKACAENTHPETTPPLKKVQREWTCDLCEVTTTSEITLNAHLHGSKHKFMCESLKTSMLHAKDTGPSPSATGKNEVGEGSQPKSAKKPQERVQCQAPSYQQKQAKLKQCVGANQIFEHFCNVCNVKLISDVDLAAHLKGQRHSSNIEKMLNGGYLN